MAHEARAAHDLGVPWEVVLQSPVATAGDRVNLLLRLVRYARLRWQFCRMLTRRAASGETIVLRHSVADVFVFVFSFFWGRYLTVHHTLEEPELAQHRGPIMRVMTMLERSLGRSIVRRADALVCVTQEIASYERRRIGDAAKPVHIYPNGIIYPEHERNPWPDARSDDVPELLFVAGYFYEWHGLNALLATLDSTPRPFVLHLVGTLAEPLPARVASDARVRVHGVLEGRALAPLMQRSWLGLSSFALQAKGMNEACTLKVRDYLHEGLAVYAGHRDSAFEPEFPYFRHGPLDMDTILDYAHAMRRVSRVEVSRAARPHIDKRALLARLYEALTVAGPSEPQRRSVDAGRS